MLDYPLNEFDDIRPYTELEVRDAIKYIALSRGVEQLLHYFYPSVPFSFFFNKILGYESRIDFQKGIVVGILEKVIDQSCTSFSYNGIENIQKGKSYLFVSNHRDILLDSALFQLILLNNGMNTTEIAVGNNLMKSEFAIHMAKLNKMIKVIRDSSGKEFYFNSLLLSKYIDYTLHVKRESIWIAQRNGRTKDGLDITKDGLVKMFIMSAEADDDVFEFIENLNIIPLSVSYEYEPCDLLKAKELFLSQENNYEKEEGEDENSMITGVLQPKGNVHIEIGEVLNKNIQSLRFLPKNELVREVTSLIDQTIVNNYRLYKSNFIAYDMLYKDAHFLSKYTSLDKEHFEQYVENSLQGVDSHKEEIRELFLGIYANPILNKRSLESTLW